jgi:hypothetical protein
MALDFPLNPTNGQAFENYYYDSSITAWRSAGSKTGVNQRTTALELADATTNKSGLVPVIPPTFSTVTGTASRTGSTVTFSGVNTISLDGAFSDTYNAYEIIYVLYGTSSAGEIRARFRRSGADVTAASYNQAGREFGSNATDNTYSGSGLTYIGLGSVPTALYSEWGGGFIRLKIPARTDVRTWTAETNGYRTTGPAITFTSVGGAFTNSGAITGISLFTTSGTISGFIQVLGYNS